MMHLLGMIFCGAATLSCFAIVTTISIIRGAYPAGPPVWLWLWVALTLMIGVIGLLFAILVALGAE